jgi:hypothetical protein
MLLLVKIKSYIIIINRMIVEELTEYLVASQIGSGQISTGLPLE